MNSLFEEPFGSAFGKKMSLRCLFGRCLAGAVNHESEGKTSLYLFVMFGAGTITEIRMKYILQLSIQIFNPSNYIE